MLNRVGWERTPLALRAGLLVTIAAHVAQLALAVAGADDGLRSTGALHALRALGQAAWVAGDVLSLVGAVELARRAPRAWTLVVAYAVGIAMYLLWIGVEVLEFRDSSHSFDFFAQLRWLEFGTTVLAIAAWLVLARNAGLIVAIVLGKLLAGLPPVFDNLYEQLGVSSFRAMVGLQSVCQLVAMLAALAIAMGVPFDRPVAARTLGARSLDALAAAVITAGGALGLLAWGGLGAGMAIPLVLVAVCALAWFAVTAARIRGGGESGAVTMIAASVAAAGVAALRLDMVPGGDFTGTVTALASPMLVVPALEIVALVLAVSGVARIARARGAERTAQLANVAALVALVAGCAAVAGAQADSHLGTLAQLGGTLVAYAAAAYGLYAGARSLGDSGELPTATLRS